jgi:TRAP-type C4-dicarboxylate transport system permease small subunit
VYSWRNAVMLGVVFVLVGIAYLFLQGTGEWMDRAGVTMLIATGLAMSLTFVVLLRGSGEL